MEVSRADYDLALVRVDRPAETKQRYGAVENIDLDTSNRFYYGDSLLAAALWASSDAINFQIENRTDHSIKVIWDESVFIDRDGTAEPVMHQGTKYAEASDSKPPP